MKIEQIYIHHINALRGRWRIDLSAYEGLFAICGATGSGKTSILDAICLALYGQTPRISKISNQNNELFRIDAKECGAEVVFSIREHRYRARWLQRRSGGQAAFQPAKHEIMDAEGRVLSDSLRSSAQMIKSLTGMDFQHFTRTALLAQGRFANFLQSNAKERSELFEAISQSYIYSDISQAVYQRAKQEQERLQVLSALMPQGTQVDEADLLKWQAELQQLQSRDLHPEIQAQLARLQSHQRLQLLQQQLQQAQQEALPDPTVALEKAERAAAIRERHQALQQARQQQQALLQQEKELHNNIIQSQAQQKEAAEALQQLCQDWERISLELQDWQNLAAQQSQKSALLQEIHALKQAYPNTQAQYAPEAETAAAEALQGRTLAAWTQDWQQLQRWQDYRAAQQRLTQLEQEAAVAERAWRIAHEAQQRYALQAQRAQLQDGSPCPLCGAEHHPYRKHQPEMQASSQQQEALYRQAQEALLRQQGLLAQWQDLPQDLNEALITQQWSRIQETQQQWQAHRLYQMEADVKRFSDYRAAEHQAVQARAHNIQQRKQTTEVLLQQHAARASYLLEQQPQLQQRLQTAQAQQQQLEALWQADLQDSGFHQEALWQQALPSPQVLHDLRQQQQQYLQQAARLQHWREEVAQIEQSLAGQSAAVIEAQLQDLQQRQQAQIERASELKQQLQQQQNLKKEQEEQALKIQEQQHITQQWRDLSALIGSADGKKFSSFAQGITFEHVIHYANQQLRLMNPRYQLIRKNNELLEFDVLDAEQAYQRRGCQNLSGGETFLLSLALALGLAQLNSQNAQVDSLFLDEGFGTLDADSLDSALEALLQLQSHGKTIGIISHVGHLKERIPQHLELLPQNGAYSLIRGVGVSYLGD